MPVPTPKMSIGIDHIIDHKTDLGINCQVTQHLLQMNAKLSLEIVKTNEQMKTLPPPPKLMSKSTFSHSALSILDQKYHLVKVSPPFTNTNKCC